MLPMSPTDAMALALARQAEVDRAVARATLGAAAGEAGIVVPGVRPRRSGVRAGVMYALRGAFVVFLGRLSWAGRRPMGVGRARGEACCV